MQKHQKKAKIRVDGTQISNYQDTSTATCSSSLHSDYENEGQAEPRDRLKPSAGWNMETAGIEQ